MLYEEYDEDLSQWGVSWKTTETEEVETKSLKVHKYSLYICVNDHLGS